jgi:hypothetical protein
MKRSQWWGTIALAVAAMGVALVAGELLIRFASPVEYLSPRYEFSREYGLMPFAGVVMEHGKPGRYHFRYTVNSDRYRGPVVDAGADSLPVIVTLGDSYTFGMGTADGREYPAVMRRELAGRAEVVNLGSPGWGLTQQVRRYAEFGANFSPAVVVLQFCSNDLEDNLAYRVAVVKDGGIVFQDSQNSLSGPKRLLSRSFLQRTQLYNFLRTRASPFVHGLLARREEARLNETMQPPAGSAADDGPPPIQVVYEELLRAFAARLDAEGRALVFIAVDHQLEQFPWLHARVEEMHARGDLRLVNVTAWLAGMENYGSPEGHLWGEPAHRVIGLRLAGEVLGAAAGADSAATVAP